MSNIVPSNIQIPAHLARVVGQPSALSAALAGGLAGGAEFPRISIKGSRFRIIEGGAETVLEDTKLGDMIVSSRGLQPPCDRQGAHHIVAYTVHCAHSPA